MTSQEIPIFAPDLMQILGIKHANTLRLKIKAKQVPEPDVKLSQKTRYWHRASLVAAGLLPEVQPPKAGA